MPNLTGHTHRLQPRKHLQPKKWQTSSRALKLTWRTNRQVYAMVLLPVLKSSVRAQGQHIHSRVIMQVIGCSHSANLGAWPGLTPSYSRGGIFRWIHIALHCLLCVIYSTPFGRTVSSKDHLPSTSCTQICVASQFSPFWRCTGRICKTKEAIW